jgi:hypothetical protein
MDPGWTYGAWEQPWAAAVAACSSLRFYNGIPIGYATPNVQYRHTNTVYVLYFCVLSNGFYNGIPIGYATPINPP